MVTDYLPKEVQDDMEDLSIHVDPTIYVRNLFEDNIYRAMRILPDED